MTVSTARRVAARMSTIGTESAFEVSARARALEAEGRSIIHLQIGEPDFDTPAHVREAAKRALDEGATHYAPFPGIPALREAIAADVALRKGVTADPSQVFVTVGGKGVMLYAILGLVDPGDEVIVPDPGYPIYESLTRFVGATPVPIPIRMEHEFRLDVDELASLITPRTRVLFINSPANPTGGVLTRSDIERVAELAIEHDLWVVTDEIYGRILYDGAEHVSIAALSGMAERTIILDGFSKTFAMTGWRLGYAVVPTSLIQTYAQLIINTISCAPTFVQVGAVQALVGPQDDVDAMVVEFKARRDLLVAGLNEIPGIRCATPVGAFYAFPSIAGTGLSGAELADRLLHEAGVCVLAGTAFGGVGTEHIRISYANSRENLTEALGRIGRFVEGWGVVDAGRPRVFVARIIPDVGLEAVQAACDMDLWDDELPPPRDELLRRVAGCDGVLTLLTDKVDDEFLDAAGPQLRVVSNYAVGFDNIDVAACARRGIPVGNTPGVLTDTTADLAWALLMAAARRLPEGDRYVRGGQWKTWGPLLLLGPDVHGATIGIVGFGRIGQAVARRAQGFGMEILYHDVAQLPDEVTAPFGATCLPLEELLPRSDFVSLHVNLSEVTRHLINVSTLALMKATAVLVNTSRGPVVDQIALADALRDGVIWAAALDVTDPEPIPMDDPLVGLDNCLIVPHIASASRATRGKMAAMAAANLIAGVRGEPLPTEVPPPA